MKPRWVIQDNLGNRRDLERMVAACKEIDLDHQLITVVPFADDLPEVSADAPTIFYGATRFIATVHRSRRWNPGVYFDLEAFSFPAWKEKYGTRLLNHDAEVMVFNELTRSTRYAPDDLVFVRPVRDLKEFAGNMMAFGELKAWRASLQKENLTDILVCPVVVAEPVGISHEWRLFIVDGRVSSGSHYRSRHRLDVTPLVPGEVIAFAEESAAIWPPAPVFVLDICQSGDQLFVLEVNCFHSSGFYAADVRKIFADVSDYVAARRA